MKKKFLDNLTPNRLFVWLGIIGFTIILTTLVSENRVFIPNLLAIAIGSALAGSLLGFLFGFPKTFKKIKQSDEVSLKLNTNLEEITDWLTKILVGIGISQLYHIKEILLSIVHFVQKDGNLSGTLILFTLLYFTIYGFYMGYIASSLHLKSLLDYKYFNAEHFIFNIENELEKFYGTGKSFIDSHLSRMYHNNYPFKKLKVLKMIEHLEREKKTITPNAYRNIGIEFFKYRDYHTALEMFLKSAQIDNNPHALSNIGVTYAKHLNNVKLGDKYIKKSMKDHPENALVNYNYACMMLRKLQKEAALEHLQKAIEINPDEFTEIAQSDSVWKILKDDQKFKDIVPNYDPED